MNLRYSLVGEGNSRITRRKVSVADSKCLSNDIKALFARNRFKLNQCKGLKAIHDSLPFTKPDRRLSFISFLQLIQIQATNASQKPLKNLHALESYCSLCYMLSYKISV